MLVHQYRQTFYALSLDKRQHFPHPLDTGIDHLVTRCVSRLQPDVWQSLPGREIEQRVVVPAADKDKSGIALRQVVRAVGTRYGWGGAGQPRRLDVETFRDKQVAADPQRMRVEGAYLSLGDVQPAHPKDLGLFIAAEHIRAAANLSVDQPFLPEYRQRLADHRLADAVAAHQLANCRQPVARGMLPQLPPEPRVDLYAVHVTHAHSRLR